jgi:uncharacterized protein (DUF427 family)
VSNLHRTPPGPDQESVWDYPRPPRVEATSRHIQVIWNGMVIADSTRTLRVLETSHPPIFYIPQSDVHTEVLRRTERATLCEWKGIAAYFSIVVGDRTAPNAAWTYPLPSPGYEALANHIAFYPAPMDACLVDGERVQPQPGDFYGGWITHEIVGPFKRG